VHVTAPDEATLGYGWGYAHAQDRGCETAEALLTAAGERSRWFGADSGARLGARVLDNRTIDFFVRAHIEDVAIEHGWRAASPGATALAQGIVDGYNRWLDELGDGTGEKARGVPCAGKEWLRPMTIGDLRRLGELQRVADGEGAWADAITRAQPPEARALYETAPRPPLGQGPGAREAVARPGGVAVALGRAVTVSGHGLLLGNPHADIGGGERWWPVHLVIPGRLDVMGVSPGTLPMLTSGFNRTLAWSSTRSAARHFTLHALTLAPDDATSYLVDGQRERMTTKLVRTIERAADGLAPADRTVYRTRYGPVVIAPELGLGWTRQTAYALQDADVDDGRWLDTWLAVARAGSADALRDALSIGGAGDLSVVAADAEGRVAYADPGAVPDVDPALFRGCLAPGGAGELWERRGIAVLDGARSACDWRRVPGTARPGTIPFERTPWLVRDDWVQSSGDGAWLAQPDAPGAALEGARRGGWSPLQGGEPGPVPLRTRALAGAMAAALDVPEPGRRLDADTLLKTWYDPRNEAGRVVLDDLITLCATAATEATRKGCAVLRAWDRGDAVSSRGAPLFREWWRRVRDLPDLWRVPFSPTHPLRSPFGLRVPPQPDPVTGRLRRDELMEALAQAVYTLRQAGFSEDAALGEVQFVRVGGERVGLPGGEAAEGTISTIEGRSAVALSKLGYEPSYGTSWLQLVDFGEAGPSARGVLLPGSVADDGAAGRREALDAYVSGHWFPLPFTADEIAAQRVGAPLLVKAW
jgi:acyl-homoserine-lactone acylase